MQAWRWVRSLERQGPFSGYAACVGCLLRVVPLIAAVLGSGWVEGGGIGARSYAQILSSKRGFADVGANYSNLQATGAGWHYTWGLGAGNPGNFDSEHYPMFWGGWSVNQNNINAVRNNPNVEWVLGFNEPEREDQANMSVANAIAAWTTLSNGFAGSGKKLVSPAVSDTGQGQAWIQDFMSQVNANNLQVDAIAFHWYGVSNPNNPAGAASAFLNRVDWYHNLANKPVFITEFAIHDWGGNYSDEAITEANRQFLDIVIPALESRSYVAGYAWYHWFSDARLYAGNPPIPTPMAYEYVGALKSGDFEEAANQDYGEHVAYLVGGELGVNGAPPTALKYVNALEGVSTLSGGVDWNLERNGWMRIQPNATLRKAGTNRLTLSGIELTNHGVLEIAEGTLTLGSSTTGAGEVVVRNGATLQMMGRAELATPSLIDLRGGAILDASAAANSLILRNGQTLSMGAGASILGTVSSTSGSAFHGSGSIVGNLSLAAGATLRIGDNGEGGPRRRLIDDLQSYALGDVRDVADPPWTAHQNTSLADIENVGGTNALSFGWAGDFRGVSRTLDEGQGLSEGNVGTYFLRINSRTDAPNHNVGIGDEATTSGVAFGDFAAQVRLKAGATPGTFDLDARNGGGFTATLAGGLALDTWYNLWLVVDHASDTYDVFLNSGIGDATSADKLNAAPLVFRNGTATDLDEFLALAGGAPVDNGVRIDDLYLFEGFDLTNPLGGYDPGIFWTPETLSVSGDYAQAENATLQLNLFDPSRHDSLQIQGNAALAGTLEVTLAVGAPLPQEGDAFDILDFAAATGAFDVLVLPTLASGLTWHTSDLSTTGTLAVVAALPGDFNFDGLVDGSDLLLWQRGDSPSPGSTTDLQAWQENFGVFAAGTPAAPVPEPGVLTLLLASLTACSCKRRR
jgi:hypothetical protein